MVCTPPEGQSVGMPGIPGAARKQVGTQPAGERDTEQGAETGRPRNWVSVWGPAGACWLLPETGSCWARRLGECRAPGKRRPMALAGTLSVGGPLPSDSDSIFPPPPSYLSRDLTSPSSTEKRERQGQI